MLDEAGARGTVAAHVAEWPKPQRQDEEVVVWKVDERTRAWIVHVATRRWIRTRDFHDQLVGASPFVVEKATGQVHLYGSGPGEFARFAAWLDQDTGPSAT
jgi:hypothetical protein